MNASTLRSTARRVYLAKSSTGFAPQVDSVEEGIADLVNNYEGEVLSGHSAIDDVAVVRCGDGEIVLIGDQNGVWRPRWDW